MKLRSLVKRVLVAVGISLVLACVMSAGAQSTTVALADTASDLEEAKSELSSLGTELQAVQDELAEAVTELENIDYQIAELEVKIAETEEELAAAQETLARTLRSSYKTGYGSLLEFILNSTSAEDLVSRVYYAQKVSSQQSEAIETIRELTEQLAAEQADLEEQEAVQSELVAELEEKVANYNARVAEVQAIVDSLDAQLQEELAAAAAEEENAALAAAVDASSVSSPSSAAADSSYTPPASVGGGLATAYEQLGKAYVWGTAGPDTFDCSGLVCYCYGYARGRTTYDMIASLQASGDWKTSMSDLNVGDLVFPHSGHVGIYIGNGQYINASSPTRGVVIDTITSFYGGGSYY